ncbi:MAG TPA: Mrp/NBP35 family ATP-binding protein [Bacteroidales bacterium]|nr:Mrp/NBP35 family ATP-binding protein [Bacteroidales bacterium]
MSVTKEQVLKALERVIHPESRKNIVELDMIEELSVKDDEVRFALRFSRPNDPFIQSMKKSCVSAIESQLGEHVKIRGNIGTIVPQEEKRETLPGVKNIIAISSGKGGVGKSTVAVNLAVGLKNEGYKVGLLDTDVYGPSVPKMFDLEDARPEGKKEEGVEWIIPIEKYGIKLLSVGFFVKPEDALVWRGPMATNALKQLITQGDWGELDYLVLDLPPGTGDVHLTIVQEVPVTGAIIVSTPQEVALSDVIKGINMFAGEKINVPLLGLVENMAWFTPEELPDNKYYIFGKEGCKALAEKMSIELLGQIPIVQGICDSGDEGVPVATQKGSITGKAFNELAKRVVIATEKRNKDLSPTQKVNIVHK